MKKLIFICSFFPFFKSVAQINYSEGFGNLVLQNYTATNGSGSYTTVPNGFQLITDARNNNIGTTLNPNTPFNYSPLKTVGWLVGYNALLNDTFLVSTSWLDTAGVSVNRWIITPPITVSAANTVLRWNAMSPDNNFKDGYEVYVTTNTTSAVTALDFPLTNRLFFLADNNTVGGGENTTWTSRSVILDNYVGQTVRFAFRNNSNNRFQLWIDNIEVEALSANRDVALNSVSANKYVLTNTNDSVSVSFTNLGASSVFSITLNYVVGNSNINSQVFFANQNGWGNQAKQALTFGLPYALTSPGYYKIKAWVSAVNGLSDQNNINDTASFFVTAQATVVEKKCLVEQFVSANNGDSPDAQEKLNALQTSTAVVAVNIHEADSMALGSIEPLLNDYKSMFSTALFDRHFFSDTKEIAHTKSNYNTRTNKRLAAVSPVSVSIINKTYNSTSKELSFTVKADFVGEVVGDYRINAYLTENNVFGKENDTLINGYNQLSNYYAVPWSPYYLKGYYSSVADAYVLNAWLYKHQNVLIHTFDSAYGKGGIIPSAGGTVGQSYLQTYTLTIPSLTTDVAMFNADNIYIVGFVAEASINKTERTVLNSVKEKLTTNAEVISVKELKALSQPLFVVYPNPSNGLVRLITEETLRYKWLQINVKDVLGRLVYTTSQQALNAPVLFDLSSLNNGTYFVELDVEGAKSTKKLIIQH